MYNLKMVMQGNTVKILHILKPLEPGWQFIGNFTHDCAGCLKDDLGYTKSHVLYHHVREMLPQYYDSMYVLRILAELDYESDQKFLISPINNRPLVNNLRTPLISG